jgi:molybdopterin-dependent oxidoreductase alpha subunit
MYGGNGNATTMVAKPDALGPQMPQAQTPLEESTPILDRPMTTAGGLAAITGAMKHALGAPGMMQGAELLVALNQFDGVDCPGCAWPEPDDHRSIAEFCENGAKAIGEEATAKRATPEFFREWSVAELSRQSDFWLGQQGRLTHPMILRKGATHYEALSWDEAFHFIGQQLRALASPDRAAFYTSGRTSNEAAFLYQLFVRQFGTNNLPDCSNMCHESSGTALLESIGRGKSTVNLADFDLADAIFVIGQNPGTNHPRMLATLEAAARRGCRIVSVNPLFEAGLNHFKHPQEPWTWLGQGTPLACLHLPVRINGDVALLKGLMKEMLEEEARRPGEVLDLAFIREHTAGFAEFRAALDQVAWPGICEQSGLERSQIREAAEIAINAKRIICCWAMGLTQHKNAVANIQEIVNFLMLGGNLGRPGAGACPVRGHSNVQGDRTMGIFEKMPDWFLDNLGREFDFTPPRKHGLDTVQTIHAMRNGAIDVFIAMGGNFLSATPDTLRTAEALARCALTVQISTKLNRSHLITGRQALILPALGRPEKDVQASGPQFVTTENSMAVVQSSRGRLAPASSELRSECAIVAGLAKATLGAKSSADWDGMLANYDRIRECIERVIPGFERYNERVRKPGGFHLPNPVEQRTFATSTGKAQFSVHPLPDLRLEPGQFLMTTIRSHDQYNTTIYGLDDRYRGIYGGRRVILMHAEDCADAGLAKGDEVDITSHFDGETRTARRFVVNPYPIPRRCVATYFPEANVLVPINHVAEKSNTPASKSVVISLKKSSQIVE